MWIAPRVRSRLQQLITQRQADVVDCATGRKGRGVFQAKLQVVATSVKDRESGSDHETKPAVVAGIGRPETIARATFDVEAVIEPVLEG